MLASFNKHLSTVIASTIILVYASIKTTLYFLPRNISGTFSLFNSYIPFIHLLYYTDQPKITIV